MNTDMSAVAMIAVTTEVGVGDIGVVGCQGWQNLEHKEAAVDIARGSLAMTQEYRKDFQLVR
jgi:hypothetical protein